MQKSKWLAVMATVVAMGLAVGCGGGDKKAAAPDQKGPSGKVMVYTSIYPDIIDKMCKPNVKKALPTLDVSWFQGGTEKLKTKIAGEMKANKIGTDVLMVADPSYYLYLNSKKVLLEYVSPNQKDVVLEKDPKGTWTPVRVSNMIIAYNSKTMKEADAPKTWKDLLDPKWKGKIAMPSPLLSGTAYVAAGALADKYGWEYFQKLKANGLHVEEGNSAIQNKLANGEYKAAMILEENILKLRETKNSPLRVIYPKDGIICVPSPIGIFNTTKNPAGAKAMVDWWLSQEGQKAVVKGWMHSVRGDVEPPTNAPKLTTLLPTQVKVNWQKLATEEAKIKEQFRKIVIDGK